MLLRKVHVRQNPGESIQIFAERLLALEEEAFPGYLGQGAQDGHGQQDIPTVIDQQCIGFFTDGSLSDPLKMKVMRANPCILHDAI